MNKRGVAILFMLSVFSVGFTQNKKVEKDSTKRDSIVQYQGTARDSIAKDSTQLYNRVRKFSKKSKLGKLLEKYILVDSSDYYNRGNKADKDKRERENENFNSEIGKIIRHIEIETYDPFGYNLEDTTQKPHSWFQKAGNAAHVKSKAPAITKFLLIKEKEELDTFLLNESDRLLRAQNYVRRVKMIPRSVEGTKDSVDIVIKVLDSWSLIPKIEIAGNHFNVGAYERNLIGMGHDLRLRYSKYVSDGNNGYEARYDIPNIRNTFIDFRTKYKRDHNHYYDKYIDLSRRFYSSTTRWAGGVFFQDRSQFRPFPGDTVDFVDKDFRFNYQDYWLGHAIPLSKKSYGEKHQKNLTISGRAMFLHYKDSPAIKYDSIRNFSDEQFYLTEIGLNSRRFVQDKYIFQDGEIEDVPVGAIYGITAGMQHKNQQNRFYTGARAAYAQYFSWGFMSGEVEAGSFVKSGSFEQSTISFKINYFTPLKAAFGRWKVRQFVKPQVVLGFNRKPGITDRLSLNDEFFFNGVNGSEYLDYDDHDRYIDYKVGSIRGFESEATGTQKYVLDLQTQFYAPWNLWGFHINPFVDVTLGYLAGKKQSFASNKFYSAFSLGVIIRNDFLVFDAFQLSLSFYPEMPGKDGSSIRTNAFRTHDYGFQNFETTEPRPVIYE